MSVDCDSAPSLSSGQNIVDDILVLHLEGGKDFFLSVTGNYLPSCFGSSLETLVHLHTYIREVPTADLLDLSLSSSWDHCSLQKPPQPSSSPSPPSHSPSLSRRTTPPLDIPKELYQMVTFLNCHALTTVSLCLSPASHLIPCTSGEPLPGVRSTSGDTESYRRSGCGRGQGAARLRPLCGGVSPPLPLGSGRASHPHPTPPESSGLLPPAHALQTGGPLSTL